MAACITRPARCARATASRGRRMLYAFCATHGVPHRRCGKLIVATEEPNWPRSKASTSRACANGVEGLELIDGAQARALEPA